MPGLGGAVPRAYITLQVPDFLEYTLGTPSLIHALKICG